MLELFLNQCLTTFLANPQLYATAKSRIIFAGSYLSGRANAWWGGYLSDLDLREPENAFLTSWIGFRQELIIRFGVTDPKAHALKEIKRLRQGPDQHVADYLQAFDQIAKHLDWNDEALADHFFTGLLSRVKKVFASRTTPRPTDLTTLAALATAMDNNYWLYEDESRGKPRWTHDSAHPGSSTDNPRQRAPPAHGPRPQRSNFQRNSGSNTNPAGRSHARASSTGRQDRTPRSGNKSAPAQGPDLTGKLNSAGKLTSEEREHRMKNGLCLYCGKSGHEAKECRKAAHNHETHGRAAAVATPSAPTAPKPSASTAGN